MTNFEYIMSRCSEYDLANLMAQSMLPHVTPKSDFVKEVEAVLWGFQIDSKRHMKRTFTNQISTFFSLQYNAKEWNEWKSRKNY